MMSVMLFCLSALCTSVDARPLGQEPVSIANLKSKEEKEAEIAAAEAEANASKEDFARVIVLRWQGTSTDHQDANLQRNVRSAIDRTDALFLPAVDLYQDGRELKDTTLPPEDQPAQVPDEHIQTVLAAAADIAQLSYEDVDPNEWLDKGLQLRDVAEKIWFVDRPELREPLFTIYTQIGRTAENLENSTPPLFEYVGGRNVNYYYYLAAVLASQDIALMSKLNDSGLKANVQYYLDLLNTGEFPSMKVDFEMDDGFDKENFEKEYELLINGLPVELDSNGETDIFLGRSDILLKRNDAGFGLSDRFESVKTEDKAYRILEIARKRMEIDFIRQLFLYENECKPEVDSDILTYLAIYAKMHAEVDRQIYIAVPKFGNPNKVWVWRFDPATTTLNLAASGKEEFPVHFVGTVGTGALYSGATVDVDPRQLGPDVLIESGDPSSAVDLDLIDGYLPFYFDLRAHYTRLMVNFGMEFGLNLNEEWVEYYQTPGKDSEDLVTVALGEDCYTTDLDGRRVLDDESACSNIKTEVYNQQMFNRNIYFGLGYVFGRDAAFGYGFRLATRVGFVNAPHIVSPTLHVGYTYPVNMLEVNKRVRPVLDVDVRGGAGIKYGRNLGFDLGEKRQAEPIFGLTLGVGSTF